MAKHTHLDIRFKHCLDGLMECEKRGEIESPRYESLANQWVRLQKRWYKSHQQYYNPILNAYSRMCSMREEI